MILFEILSTRTNFSAEDNEMEIGRIPVRPDAPSAIRARIMTFFFMDFASNNSLHGKRAGLVIIPNISALKCHPSWERIHSF